MTCEQFLRDLAAADVRLSVNGDKLRFSAPANVLTDELRIRLREHKLELLALLRGDADSLKRMDAINISIGILEDGTMRIITSPAEESRAVTDGVAIYTPTDHWHAVQLQPA